MGQRTDIIKLAAKRGYRIQFFPNDKCILLDDEGNPSEVMHLTKTVDFLKDTTQETIKERLIQQQEFERIMNEFTTNYNQAQEKTKLRFLAASQRKLKELKKDMTIEL